jgi:hypothetical protein
MKKPNFIEIRLPGRKSTFSGTKTKYFKHLENKVLEINFGKEKERKLFSYRVLESSFVEPRSYWDKKKKGHWSLKLELKVPTEDPDKVL